MVQEEFVSTRTFRPEVMPVLTDMTSCLMNIMEALSESIVSTSSCRVQGLKPELRVQRSGAGRRRLLRMKHLLLNAVTSHAPDQQPGKPEQRRSLELLLFSGGKELLTAVTLGNRRQKHISPPRSSSFRQPEGVIVFREKAPGSEAEAGRQGVGRDQRESCSSHYIKRKGGGGGMQRMWVLMRN